MSIELKVEKEDYIPLFGHIKFLKRNKIRNFLPKLSDFYNVDNFKNFLECREKFREIRIPREKKKKILTYLLYNATLFVAPKLYLGIHSKNYVEQIIQFFKNI